jgi:predicted esterase
MAPSKALLCFHGTGSKGYIFNVQMARICRLLKDEFEFIFLDGPSQCAAGPGVLPTFHGEEPYYCWFGREDKSIDESLERINESVGNAIAQWNVTKVYPDAKVVGAIGFSEGALAVTFLLWQQQHSAIPWLPELSFAVMSCCFFPNEAALWLNSNAQTYGQNTARISVPTLHVHGNKDFSLARARRLVKHHYEPEAAFVVQCEAGHHLPTSKADLEMIISYISDLSTSKARKDSVLI